MHEAGGISSSRIKVWKRGRAQVRGHRGRGDAAEVGETRRERRCGTLYVYDNRRNSGGLVVFGAVKVKTRPLGY